MFIVAGLWLAKDYNSIILFSQNGWQHWIANSLQLMVKISPEAASIKAFCSLHSNIKWITVYFKSISMQIKSYPLQLRCTLTARVNLLILSGVST